MSGDPFRRPRLVVVGNGMAGMRAVEELISRAPDRFDITVIGAEPHPNYSRILLSAVLAGERTFEDIVLNSRDWYEQHGICLIAGKRATPLGGAAYAASKFGMRALGICLAAEEKDSGIRVSNIYPGEVDTPILENRPTPVSEAQRQIILQPEDVAQAVVFVATLPPRVSVPELVIKPTAQQYI